MDIITFFLVIVGSGFILGLITKGWQDWDFISRQVLLLSSFLGIFVFMAVLLYAGFNVVIAELVGGSFMILAIICDIVFIIGWAIGDFVEATLGFVKKIIK